MEKFQRHIPTVHMHNLRSIGGYAAAQGTTRPAAFYRGDKTSDLTLEEIEQVKALGITLVVDLRADVECEARPSSLQNVAGLHYTRVPLFDGFLLPYIPKTMGEVYVQLLEESPAGFAEIARLALATQGGCLFHCTSGKDRTGITAMLLLQLAGVCDADIVEDYCLTELYDRVHLDEMIARMHAQGKEEKVHMFTARAPSMQTALTHLYEKYGSARTYFLRAGLTPDEITALQEKLVQHGPL